MNIFWIIIVKLCIKNIFSDIYYYRSRSSRTRNEKSFFQYSWQIFNLFHQVIMFGYWRRNTKNISLLERVFTNIWISYLSCYTHQRHRISISCCNTSNQICCARTRRSKYYTCFASSSSITISSMYCTLFMSGKYMRKIHRINRIVQCQHGSARITENHIYAFFFQTL